MHNKFWNRHCCFQIYYRYWTMKENWQPEKPIPKIQAFGNDNFVESKGFIEVPILSNNIRSTGIFIVTKGNFTPILGVGNIWKLNIDLNYLVHSTPAIHQISSSNYSNLQINVLQELFRKIFESGLGHCSKIKKI